MQPLDLVDHLMAILRLTGAAESDARTGQTDGVGGIGVNARLLEEEGTGVAQGTSIGDLRQESHA